ncbi:MAG TPA: hypothetical protein VI248_14745, partial [Kineosporiaceae bacterium]
MSLNEAVLGAFAVFEATAAIVTAYRRAIELLEDRSLGMSDDTRFAVAAVAVRVGRFVAHGDLRLQHVLLSLPQDDPR